MKKIWIGIIIIAVLVLAIVLVITQTKKEPNEIKLGIINSLTGSAAVYGKNSWDGIKLAVDEINNAGGINGKKIKVLLEDDRTDSQAAVSAFTKFVKIDKIPVIIGPASSSSVMACAPIANESKTVILSPGAGSPNITYAGDYVFRNRAAGSVEATVTAKFAFDKLNLKKISILYINTDYGVGFKDVFKKQFEELGGKIIFIESYDQGQTDFRTQLAKLKGIEPDGVYILGTPIEVGHILRQSLEMGFNTKFLMNNMESPELLKIAGKAAEGIYFAIPTYDPNAPNPRVREFEAKYFSLYGKQSDMFAADGYDAVYLVKLAIEKGGYNGEGIKNALYSIKDFLGVNGTITFDKNGDVIKPLAIKTVINGKFVAVETQ